MGAPTKTKGLILRATKYGESDLIVSVLTLEGTKISLLARGALRSKKRFAGGVLEPTHFVELQFQKAASENRLSVLTEALLLDGFEGLRKNYDKVETALFVIETLSKVSQEGDIIAEGLFNLAGNSLRALEKTSDLKTFKLHFCLKLLFQQGTLEPENWMGPYLKISMVEHEALKQNADPQRDLHLIWVESRLREYLSTGMLST